MIYVITHKDFDDSRLNKKQYCVLHVGSSQTRSNYFRDDTGDNISEKNRNYCELTGLYWIWKNDHSADDEIVGLVHYRRYFTTRLGDFLYTYLNKSPEILPYNTILDGLRRNDVILPVMEIIVRTVRQYYCDEHIEEDLDITRAAIATVCPEYLSAYDTVLNQHAYYYGNMMICRMSVLRAYCAWLFSVLFEVEKHIDLGKYPDDYQRRVFGFLSERLLQVWFEKNNYRVKEYPVFNTEYKRINFFQKNASRMRKILKKR